MSKLALVIFHAFANLVQVQLYHVPLLVVIIIVRFRRQIGGMIARRTGSIR